MAVCDREKSRISSCKIYVKFCKKCKNNKKKRFLELNFAVPQDFTDYLPDLILHFN